MKQKEKTPRKALVDLLILISKRGGEPITADAAFSELYGRFESRIKRVCGNMYFSYTHRSHKADVADLCQSVLEKVYLRVITFRVEECAELCEKEKERKFLNWISGIARNELRDQFRKKTERPLDPLQNHEEEPAEFDRPEIKRGDIPHLIDEMMENISDAISGTVKENSPAEILHQRMHELFNALPVREADILRTYLEHNPYNIPTEELDRLQSTYNTTRENIRQIKKRVLKRFDSKMK